MPPLAARSCMSSCNSRLATSLAAMRQPPKTAKARTATTTMILIRDIETSLSRGGRHRAGRTRGSKDRKQRSDRMQHDALAVARVKSDVDCRMFAAGVQDEHTRGAERFFRHVRQVMPVVLVQSVAEDHQVEGGLLHRIFDRLSSHGRND